MSPETVTAIGSAAGEDRAGHPAMALIEIGIAALGTREARVLGFEQSLQIGGIVNGVRPGVAGKEAKAACHLASHVERQPVINGVAGRFLLIHAVVWHGNPETGG